MPQRKPKRQKKANKPAVFVLLALVFAVLVCSCSERKQPGEDTDINAEEQPLYHEDLTYSVKNDAAGEYIEITGFTSEYQTVYAIPSEIDGIKVKKIADYAFNYATLVELTLPDTLEEIGYGAFYNCPALTSVSIPESVKKIGSYAFYKCVLLEKAVIPDTVEVVGGLAFYGTPYLENSTEDFLVVGDGILINCASESENIVLPDIVKCISSAFYKNTTVKSVKLNDGLEIIGEGAFFGCENLEKIDLSSSLKEIGNSAFKGCPKLALEVYGGIAVSDIAFD